MSELLLSEKALTNAGIDVEKREPSHTISVRDCKLVQPLWRIVWRFLKKLKIELPCNPAIALLAYLSRGYRDAVLKGHMHPKFIVALSTTAKVWKELKCPSMDEWIKKWYIYTMEYYSAIKKNEILLFVTTWMELEGIMLSEIRERQNSYDFTHMRTFKRKHRRT